MKKNIQICTVTHHTVPNFGAVWQAYALQKAIKSIGYDSELLNYHSERVDRVYHKTYCSCRNLQDRIKYLFNSKNRRRYKKFDKFIESELNISKSYNKDNLKLANEFYDLFITGSDQVWNLKIHEGDTSYMLDFVEKDKKKGSYAASFGYSEIPDEFVEKSKFLLKDFDYLYVREETGKNILSAFGRDDAKVVLDPTLLLDFDSYNKFIMKNENEDYILFYDLINSKELIKFAMDISKNTGIRIISINTSSKGYKKMINLNEVGPIEFLNLIYYAKYVVTSSYHGVIYSLLFNKVFFYGTSNLKKNSNSRLIDLSKKLRFEQQHISNSDINYFIDYKKINFELGEMRKKSINILKKMILDSEQVMDQESINL